MIIIYSLFISHSLSLWSSFLVVFVGLLFVCVCVFVSTYNFRKVCEIGQAEGNLACLITFSFCFYSQLAMCKILGWKSFSLRTFVITPLSSSFLSCCCWRPLPFWFLIPLHEAFPLWKSMGPSFHGTVPHWGYFHPLCMLRTQYWNSGSLALTLSWFFWFFVYYFFLFKFSSPLWSLFSSSEISLFEC